MYHVLCMATGCLAGERSVLQMWEMEVMGISEGMEWKLLYCTFYSHCEYICVSPGFSLVFSSWYLVAILRVLKRT